MAQGLKKEWDKLFAMWFAKFSAAGIIHGDTRKSTSEEKIETLLFVKQNCDAAVIKS